MSNSWRQANTRLTDFIAEHPEVKIEASMVSIPESIRPEFYRLFNTVRTALVKEKFPALRDEASLLSYNYLKVEQEVIKLMDLDDISMMTGLGRFLHDPVDQLRRGLYDHLFDLLKGKINSETFEERSSQNIEASFRLLYRLGYEKWVALSLVKLLEADRLFQVIPREILYEVREVGSSGESVPAPEESKRLLFRHEPTAALTVPDFIVHSAKINRYVALRSEIGTAPAITSDASEEREWYPLDSVVASGPGLTLIYVADDPREISLVADAKKICRPDLIIECREQKDWYEKEGLEKAKLRHDSLKPRLGTYIVSREPIPKLQPEEQEVDIHILSVRFDFSKLEPIISITMNQEDKDQ